MRVRDVRFLTAIALMRICAFTIARGSNILHFSVATSTGSHGARAQNARSWISTLGLASIARQYAIVDNIDRNDVKQVIQRRDQLSDLLSTKPFSSREWVTLAEMRSIAGQPNEKLFGALALSVITGPNEPNAMEERAIFGVSLWEILPAEFKKRAAVDLAGGTILDPESDFLRPLVAGKSEAVRNELRAALVAEGVSSNGLEAIGFVPARN